MKKAILTALLLGASFCARAQNFNPTANYTTGTPSPLFATSSGFTISGLGVDATTGNLFYLESGSFGGSSDTRLFQRTAASNFATEIQLFSYGANVSGSFVRVSGAKVYFGEYSLGTIRSVNLDGSSPATLTTLVGNYDLALAGTTAFISANQNAFPSDPDNKVFALNLANNQLDTVLDTGGDYSGPVAIDAAGDLLYGATNFGSIAGGIFKFTAAQVTQARLNHTQLAIGNGVRIYDNGNNAYLARENDSRLFSFNNPFGAPSTATRLDLNNLALHELAGQTDTGPFFGAVDATSTDVYVAVTDSFSSGPSAVYRVSPVPEPSAWAFMAMVVSAGSVGFLVRRK